MIRWLITGAMAAAAILAVSALTPVGVIRAGAVEETDLIHRQGRVSINLPRNGSLAVCRFEGGQHGIVWPRADGAEFLGSGGFFLRFRRAGVSSYDIVIPVSFEDINTGVRKRDLFEGCEGGKRHPRRDSDDDGDGSIDEDLLDGRDNDRDGLVDEDFAAIGDGMVVTRAVEPSAGLIMYQSSYTWNYGHVRDFIGFTTLIEYPAAGREREEGIRDITLALYTDFDIGDPDKERRGSDDRFFYIGEEIEGALGMRTFELPAASGGESSGQFVTALVFEATSPAGTVLDVDGFIVSTFESADSLWVRLMRAGKGAGGVTAGGGPDSASPPEALCTYGAVDGDGAIIHRLGPVPRMVPGDRVTIEWALVFGRSVDALVKNVRRALETYRGIVDEEGTTYRWVVPARRAARREFNVTLASIWTEGHKQPAAAVEIPGDLEPEEVEWLRVDGQCTTLYERVGSKIILPVEKELIMREEPFTIEGQLTDGTIFTAEPSAELLRAYSTSGDLPPDRLPDDSMHMFPNPFLTSLTIDVNVPGPSAIANSTTHGLEGTSSVRVYDVKGRLVRTILAEEFLHPGSYRMGWDGCDENGGKVAPGVYYCKLQIGARSLTKRVILLR